MAIFTNKIGVERVVDVSRPYAFLPCSIVSVPIGCGGCWPLPRVGLMSCVVLVLGNSVVGGLIHRPSLGRGGRRLIRIRCIKSGGGARLEFSLIA